MKGRAISSSAVISDDGVYRYRLDRYGSMGGTTLAFLMVNPSTADASADDATIRKCMGFADALGHEHLIVGNLFAYRSTNVSRLRGVHDPVGPDNDLHLAQIAYEADTIIVAWGSSNKLPKQLRRRYADVNSVLQKIGQQTFCLGVCADGQPKHPLFVPYKSALTEWKSP